MESQRITQDAEFTVCSLAQGILRFKRPAPQKRYEKQSCAWQLSAKDNQLQLKKYQKAHHPRRRQSETRKRQKRRTDAKQ